MRALWCLCLAVCLGWSSAHAFKAAGYEKGLLWKIERAGTAPSYVFGTIHSEDERVLALPSEVKSALDGSTIFVMEAVMDEQAMQAVSRHMMFSDGRSLKGVLNVALYEKARSAMAAYGIPEVVLQQMKPWAVATTLSMPKPKTGAALDLVLMQDAVAQGKSAPGLETADEQLSILDDLSLPEQITMLEDALAIMPEVDALFEQMLTLYLARDLGSLARLSEEMEQQGNRELGRKVMAKLLDARNVRMAQRADKYLKRGNAFIAVGALHLPGHGGVLDLLARKGYRISVVY